VSQEHLSDGEIACIDAIKTVLEVMIARGLITPQEMAEPYRRQANGYLQKKMPAAAGAMTLLVQFLENPARNAARALLNVPSKGEA
jgi:hypothetical protein